MDQNSRLATLAEWGTGSRYAAVFLLVLGLSAGAGLHAGCVSGQRIVNADSEPGNWLAHGRTYSEQRFSPLDEIDAGNVGSLGLAWSFSTGSKRGLEATPLVADGVMYVTGTWSRVYALDAASGELKWRFDPEVSGATARKACCDVVNRGVALWGDKLYLGTLDGRLIALDAADGTVAWQVMTVDPRGNYTITGAPRVVKGKVIIGNGGADLGVRGYFTAYDAETGAEIWRFYTVPADPATTAPEHPELKLALATWSKDSAWETGLGGTVWDSMAYDPEIDLLYVGVGNATPWNRQLRSPGGGDNLFVSSILAVNPDTGRLAWYYQTTPAETWDFTATQHIVLADLVIAGQPRKVLMQAPKNGFFYVLDRVTGELLSARNYVPVSWASGIDIATGRPIESGADWGDGPAAVQPGPLGGHNWQPMSFNPVTGLVYIPVTPNEYLFVPAADFTFRAGAWNTGQDLSQAVRILREAAPKTVDASSDAPSRLQAWDPVANRPAWHVDLAAFKAAGVLSTAGGLVFQGTGGSFVAYDAGTGDRLWASQTGVGIIAPPVSYSVDGEQYIAVMAGLGGNSLSSQPVNIENEGRILAYKPGGRATMPAFRERALPEPELPDLEIRDARVEQGEWLYITYCMSCHGLNAVSGGMLPDLRYASGEVHRDWMAIVLGGLLAQGGMAGFADVLRPEEARMIHAYVVNEARKIGPAAAPATAQPGDQQPQ